MYTLRDVSYYLEDYEKMQVLRKVAKEFQDKHLNFILKTVDEMWDKEIQKFVDKVESKKPAFATKF